MEQILITTSEKYSNYEPTMNWVDPNDYYSHEDFINGCNDIFSDEEDPELRFINWENIPDCLIDEYNIHDELWNYLNYDDDEKKVITEFWDECDSSLDCKGVIDRYCTDLTGPEYAEEICEDIVRQNIPEYIKIDWDATWDNISSNFCETTHYIFTNN